MKGFPVAMLLAGMLAATAVAQEQIEFFIPSNPEGAVVKRNNEEWGLTGQQFRVEKHKLPLRGDLNLQLVRQNYESHHLVIPAMVIQQGQHGVVSYPTSPITLKPNHPLVPLQENPLPLLVILLGLGGVAHIVRRNKRLSQSIEERGSREARLKDQIKDQHEFAFTLMGNYRVLEQLGEGGIAKVYRAIPDETLDESQAVAIKVLHPHLCREVGHRERFVREGMVSKQLVHPNIIRLFELDTDDEIVYLVLELLKGQTLKQEIGGQRLSLQRTVEITGQVLEGLTYAHSQNVVHRDLTPSNIMITEHGLIKLMDFGLARSREVGHTVTVTGVVQGTPGYMAPEQLTETLDARTDQYSLGVILFEMLTGRRPIERSDPMQLIMATYTEDAPDPRDFYDAISPPVSAFVLKLLRRDPAERFPDMESAAKAFHQAFGGALAQSLDDSEHRSGRGDHDDSHDQPHQQQHERL